MPFSGSYTLQGDLVEKNQYRGVPELNEAGEYLDESTNDISECILLNSEAQFDVSSGEISEPFTPVNMEEKRRYEQNVLKHRQYEFESKDYPTLSDLKHLVKDAYDRMESKRQEISFSSETNVRIHLLNGVYARVSMSGEGYEFVDEESRSPPFVEYRVDSRLLHQILEGPQHAHWNNAEIGSHITFYRNPNDYERGLYYCMNFFHS